MTREEAIEALRKQREQQASSSSSVRVKRERAPTLVIYDNGSDDEDEDDEGGVSITSVGPVKKRQRTSADSGVEMIDLTGE